MAVLFLPFSLLVPKEFKIIWFSNLLTMIISDECYSRDSKLDIFLFPVSFFFFLFLFLLNLVEIVIV